MNDEQHNFKALTMKYLMSSGLIFDLFYTMSIDIDD